MATEGFVMDEEIRVTYKVPRELIVRDPRNICIQAMQAYSDVMDRYNQRNLRFVLDYVIISVQIVVEAND